MEEPKIDWIPAPEMPKEQGFYLVTEKEKGFVFVNIEHFWRGEWADAKLLRREVLAWSPLPKIWEGEGE